jgi:hypothetical protein
MESAGVGTRVGVAVGGTAVAVIVGEGLGTAEDVVHPARNRNNSITFIICTMNFETLIPAPFHTTTYRHRIISD